LVIFILAFFVIFFWGAFEQAGASLTLFADRQTDRSVLGWDMPAEYFQSVNPLSVILLAPLFSILWGILYKRNAEPSSPTKMAYGLTLVAVGYAVIAVAVNGLGVGEKVSMWWLVALYVIHTMGELCLSPIGLSMVSKLAPLRLSSLLMGTWFLANAAANKFAGTLSALIPPSEITPTTTYPSFLGIQITNLFEFFMLFIVMTGVAAGILFFLSRTLQRMMNTPAEI
jgi:POT family proton-dependent oligopeptide transporter